jgi:hypothetical protein
MLSKKIVRVLISLLSIVLIALVSSCAVGSITQSSEPSLAQTEAPASQEQESSSANWESRASSVPELVAESDLVVYGRVAQTPITRVVIQELPMLDEKGTPVAVVTDSLPFADTLFEVVKTYWGTPPAKLLVMQTGGVLPSSAETVAMPDDPLYDVGEEYVLFLVDISGDKMHAPDRQLYRVVNPAGRFLVANGRVNNYDALQRIDSQLPRTIEELEKQIHEAALAKQPTP